MELTRASIVILGDMNPAIYSPGWLRRYRILDAAEIEVAETGQHGGTPLVVTAEVAQIPCKSFTLQVQRDKFIIAAQVMKRRSELPTIASRIFAKLEHTPVRALGINLQAETRATGDTAPYKALRSHYLKDQDAIGNTLNGVVGEDVDWELHVKVVSRTSNPKYTVTLWAPEGESSVYTFGVNYHYEVGEGSRVTALLSDRFEKDCRDFDKLIVGLRP